VDGKIRPAAARSSGILIGVSCGIAASLGWAAGFVAAKHGVAAGFSPADIAFHRFFWSGLLLLPVALCESLRNLGGIGWGRGLAMSVLSGPPQAIIAYTGFMLVPLGHGTTIQPGCAALFGLILATLILGERLTGQRILGGVTIIAGLMVFGAESLATIGGHGVGGDLLFATAGLFWAIFGTLLRYWRMEGRRAIAAVGALSVLVYAPVHAVSFGFAHMVAAGLAENLLQVAAQGMLSGVLAIYLFARSAVLLGGGRAGVFPALVPGFALAIGFVTIGEGGTGAQRRGVIGLRPRRVLRPE